MFYKMYIDGKETMALCGIGESGKTPRHCGEPGTSGGRGSRFRKIGVKTSEGGQAGEEEKYSRDREQVQRQGGRISRYRSGEEPRHTTTRSDSRSGRVSSRSVALFVNAELRAQARVTGSSRKASWGFMVLPYSSPYIRLESEETRTREGNDGESERCGKRQRRMVQKGRTVNLVSTDPRQVQGRTVAPTTPPSVPLLRPSRNLHPFCLELPSNPWNESPIPLASLGFTTDGWMNGVRGATHSCLHTPSPALSASLRYYGILADYLLPERRANNNSTMTCNPADHLSHAFVSFWGNARE